MPATNNATKNEMRGKRQPGGRRPGAVNPRRRPTTTPTTTSPAPLSSMVSRVDRDPEDELERREDHQRAEAEEIRDADEPHEVRPPAPTADTPQHSGSHAEDEEVEDEKAAERPSGHACLRANRNPARVGEDLVLGAERRRRAAVAEDPRAPELRPASALGIRRTWRKVRSEAALADAAAGPSTTR